mmetsp:Transcript_65310/g.206311  ORF Transcript_65310/g.206311 Transcript_65310/m.206311 type:complete len:438 (+) Transcript_65310:104-1417(+)
MDFSEVYRHCGPAPKYSPDGRYLATVVDYRLVVRDVDTLQVVQLFSCLDMIEHVEWACDSDHILCALYKRAIVQAWCVSEPDWTCKIDEGPAGITHAQWAPDGKSILSTADFQIRFTVWSLVSKSCIYIKAPKFAGPRGISFTRDGKFMALAERRDCRDAISIFRCNGWEVAAHFPLDTTDMSDMAWSPDGSTIAVWDTALDYRLLVYAIDGRLLHKFSAYDNALGIKSVSWSPSGQLLAVGSFDQHARVLNNITWKPFAEFSHTTPIRETAARAVVYEEEVEPAPPPGADEDAPEDLSRYLVSELPVTIPEKPCDVQKPNPKQGVGMVNWSHDSAYLMTRNENMPTTLWIWDTKRLELAAVLIQKDPIKSAAWDPHRNRVAMCTGGKRVYVWAPEGASCIHIPLGTFRANGLQWNPSGTAFALCDKDSFCCAFLGT